MSPRLPLAAEAAIAAAVAALGLASPRVTALSGGRVNRSFRLRAGREDLVLKLTGEAAAGLGASFGAEVAMQALAAGAGLAPAVLLADGRRGFVVSRHAAGRTPAAAELRDPRLLRRIGAWISALHRLPVPQGLAPVDFGERAAAGLARLRAARDDGFIERLARALDARRAALAPSARLAACHHDLHRRNFVDDGSRLLVVDWEYAGPGDPAADLASCIGYHALGRGEAQALLDGYGMRDAAFAARVDALGWIFDCLWFAWNAEAGLAGLPADPREQSRLAARLAP